MRRKIKNPKVVIYSFIALGFMALAFFVYWMFIIGAIIMIYLNQKELMSGGKNKEKEKKTTKNKKQRKKNK